MTALYSIRRLLKYVDHVYQPGMLMIEDAGYAIGESEVGLDKTHTARSVNFQNFVCFQSRLKTVTLDRPVLLLKISTDEFGMK